MLKYSKEQMEHLAVEQAARSKAVKRKVGCAIIANGERFALGRNHNPVLLDGRCEDEFGQTLSSVVHAEVAAIANFKKQHPELLTSLDVNTLDIYVTHQPCENCQKAISNFATDIQATAVTINVVEQGLKFDTDKLDFTLIPRIVVKAIAKVLQFGMKKYKRDNWRQVDPKRYVAAFERHWDAYLDGEMLDEDSGLPHLAHAMTNLAFLLELGHVPERQQTLQEYCDKMAKK